MFDLYISHPRYTVLLLTEDCVVTEAPPIARWMIGKTLYYIICYCKRQSDCKYQYIAKEPAR